MDRLRQHLSRRRRSSSSSATPLQSPRFPSTDRRQDERDVSPRRLYVTSDTHDFDPSIIARFQGEGFEVEYLPFPGGNEDIERDRKDLLNLLHEREDNLEPGERYAVVAYHRPAFLLLASHHQSTTATNPLPRMCALVTYYPREPLDETCKEETNSPACLLPPSTTSTSTSSCYASLSLLPIQIHLAGHQNPSFWDDYSAHPSRKRHRCHLFFYPESEPGFAEHPSHTYDRLSSRVAWSRALDCLKRGFGWPGGSWKTPDVETIWEEYWRNLLFDARRHPDAEGYAANVMKMMIGSGDPSSLDRQIDETPLVNCVPTMVGGSDEQSISALYAEKFFPTGPPSQHIRLLSRTVGPDRIVDEILLAFRHTEEIPWLLPRVPPTDRDVKIVLVMTASFRAGKLSRQNIYWDQASVLVQIGLLDPALVPGSFRATGKTREGRQAVEMLPVVGAEGVERVLNG
ncbi:dienelactone hydrolase [Aspergillus fischeri NRRL 181]|uniref:Dienelactone hydrolase n=1 Tax=Neosartorya fischeri (strain ATCC 1020 / DSM 3700 / CBS 544.65 / FGSC A1164 / JCM 1740 / NRRL 181 / WB 181) TaxID=331117 RepID=A1DFZ9_NEOFI|nr:dienelactone hydrolase [Aspergillus fischeri NRRL 181]EAW18306.1 dienelactone hydrolase [Aspergillus fischeri NRRL 181]